MDADPELRRLQTQRRDGRHFDGQLSLSGHCGHRAIFGAQRSVANDPARPRVWCDDLLYFSLTSMLRAYFARFHTITVLPPACRPGLSIFSSSPVNVATRFTLEATWFGKELRSIFSMIVLSASLTV